MSLAISNRLSGFPQICLLFSVIYVMNNTQWENCCPPIIEKWLTYKKAKSYHFFTFLARMCPIWFWLKRSTLISCFSQQANTAPYMSVDMLLILTAYANCCRFSKLHFLAEQWIKTDRIVEKNLFQITNFEFQICKFLACVKTGMTFL